MRWGQSIYFSKMLKRFLWFRYKMYMKPCLNWGLLWNVYTLFSCWKCQSDCVLFNITRTTQCSTYYLFPCRNFWKWGSFVESTSMLSEYRQRVTVDLQKKTHLRIVALKMRSDRSPKWSTNDAWRYGESKSVDYRCRLEEWIPLIFVNNRT